MREHADVIDWTTVSKFQTLSIDFIIEFEDSVNWELVSQYQTLTEDVIAQNYHRVTWCFISQYQVMSDDFIRKWHFNIWWERLPMGKNKLSHDLIREYAHKIPWTCLVFYGHVHDKHEAAKLGCDT